jgi:anti-sigma factor RsiW
MKGPEQLPKEIVWTADGHLSEVAMTTIADGEEAILPRDAFGHLGLCEACAAGVESAASLSAAVSRALTVPAPAEVPQAVPVRLAFPVWAAALAVTIATLATLPNLSAMRTWIARLWWAFREGTPVLTRQAVSILPHAWNWLPLVSLTAAMLLLLVGLSVARLAPRALER